MNTTSSDPVRIVELRSTYRDGGGPDKTILLSAKAHDRTRYDVRCVYLRGAWDDAFNIGKRAQALGIPFEEVLERGRIDPLAMLRLARIIARHRPHVIHTHDYKTDVLGFLMRPFFPRAALLATAHGWTLDNRQMDLYNAVDRRVLRYFDHVIAVSGATRVRLEAVGVPSERLSVLYNGIDIHAWRPGPHESAAASLRAELGLPDQARLLGFIGRLSPEKDVSTAMAVARRVLDQIPDAHVLVVGEGATQVELPALVRDLKMADRVHLLGHRPVDSRLYHALDAYYMTSLTEGLPNTLLEAMASGCPSVVTPVGGIPELVGDSGGAVLCPVKDVEGLSAAILGLMCDPVRARAMGEAARCRIEAAFSFSTRLSRIEAIYEMLRRKG